MNFRLSLITLLLIVCALCSTPSFAEVVEIKGYHYNINKEEKVATLVRYTYIIRLTITYENTFKIRG